LRKNIFSFVFGKAKTLRIFAPSFTGRSVKHTTKKRIQQCQVKREHINHRGEREETSMVLESAWLLLMGEKFSPEEERKEGKNLAYPLNQDTKNK